MVLREIRKSNYEQLIKEYTGIQKNWVDPDFKQVTDSQIAGWARIHDILPKANFMSKHV